MSIIVLGDLIVDEYWMGLTSRLSPEAPVPVITNMQKHRAAGGAANVALNIHSMGSPVELISQVDNTFDHTLLGHLKYNLLNCSKTPNKARILSNDHVICRIDNEQYQMVKPNKTWIKPETNICVLSDYNKGFLHDTQTIINWCNKQNIKTIVDPKKSWDNYSNCWLLKANWKELNDQAGATVETRDLYLVCDTLSKQYHIENLVITLGEQGLFVYTPTGSKHILTCGNHVVDVTGAGDVVIAAIAHYTYQGLELISAAEYANKLAGISVSKQGCYTVTPQDLSTIEDLTVFTNGCFDVLHRGHIDYLRTSKSYGTRLVVGLNSDRSVRELKGPGRPVNNEHDRKAMLESLEFVDEVIIFDESTPRNLIQYIKPDIITKGGDYTVDQVVGNDLVNQVVIIPLTDGLSTTKLLDKLDELEEIWHASMDM